MQLSLKEDQSFIRMSLIIKLNSFSQDTQMELLLKYLRKKELIYFQIIMYKEMHGIIDFTHLMMHKV